MSTKQNLCRYVIFSQNCCFVAKFVDKAKGLVDDSTTNKMFCQILSKNLHNIAFHKTIDIRIFTSTAPNASNV